MTEIEDIIDEFHEELHQNFTVNIPGTINGQKFETFKSARLPTMYLMLEQTKKIQNFIVQNCKTMKLR